jgi:transposase
LSKAAAIRSRKVGMDDGTWHCVLWLHGMRQQLVKFRTIQINSLRGLLIEYGEAMGKGREESLPTRRRLRR